MTLSDFTLIRSAVPLKSAFTTALRTTTHIKELILILSTQSGLEGIGSAPDTQAVTGDTIALMEHEMRHIVEPAFLDYTLDDYDSCFKKLQALKISKSTQALMDIALHDLFAKAKNVPLYRFLEADTRTLTTLFTISIDTPEAMFIKAYEALNKGFTQLKIKLDNNLKSNIKRLEAMSTLESIELFLDPNQALNLEDTLTLVKAVSDLPVVLIEQPLAKEAHEAMQKLTQISPIPHMADESLFSLNDAKHLYEHKACTLFNIKLMKCGGIYEARKILEFAKEKNIGCMMGSMLESAPSVTAALHLAFAYDIIIYTDLDGPLLAKKAPVDGGIYYEKNRLFLENRAGLGIIF